MDNYDYEQLISPPDPVEVATCDICKGEIYADQEYYLMDDGRTICQDCLSEWASEFGTAMCGGKEL